MAKKLEWRDNSSVQSWIMGLAVLIQYRRVTDRQSYCDSSRTRAMHSIVRKKQCRRFNVWVATADFLVVLLSLMQPWRLQADHLVSCRSSACLFLPNCDNSRVTDTTPTFHTAAPSAPIRTDCGRVQGERGVENI